MCDMELPKYQSHKVVRAAKIIDIIERVHPPKGSDVRKENKWGALVLDFGDAVVDVDFAYGWKHNPQVGGYYVVYEDGYQSFSPAEAFESGYTLLRD